MAVSPPPQSEMVALVSEVNNKSNAIHGSRSASGSSTTAPSSGGGTPRILPPSEPRKTGTCYFCKKAFMKNKQVSGTQPLSRKLFRSLTGSCFGFSVDESCVPEATTWSEQRHFRFVEFAERWCWEQPSFPRKITLAATKIIACYQNQ